MTEEGIKKEIQRIRQQMKNHRRGVRRMRKRGIESSLDFQARKESARVRLRIVTERYKGLKGMLESFRMQAIKAHMESIKDLPVIRVPSPDNPEKKRRGRLARMKPAWAKYGRPESKPIKQGLAISAAQERALGKLSETEWKSAFKLGERITTLQHLVAYGMAEVRGYDSPGEKKITLEFLRKTGIVLE